MGLNRIDHFCRIVRKGTSVFIDKHFYIIRSWRGVMVGCWVCIRLRVRRTIIPYPRDAIIIPYIKTISFRIKRNASFIDTLRVRIDSLIINQHIIFHRNIVESGTIGIRFSFTDTIYKSRKRPAFYIMNAIARFYSRKFILAVRSRYILKTARTYKRVI